MTKVGVNVINFAYWYNSSESAPGMFRGYPGYPAQSKCLTVPYEIDFGAGVVTWDCVNGANQQWYYDFNTLTIRSKYYEGLCLDPFFPDNGTPVLALTCGASHQWDYIGGATRRGRGSDQCPSHHRHGISAAESVPHHVNSQQRAGLASRPSGRLSWRGRPGWRWSEGHMLRCLCFERISRAWSEVFSHSHAGLTAWGFEFSADFCILAPINQSAAALLPQTRPSPSKEDYKRGRSSGGDVRPGRPLRGAVRAARGGARSNRRFGRRSRVRRRPCEFLHRCRGRRVDRRGVAAYPLRRAALLRCAVPASASSSGAGSTSACQHRRACAGEADTGRGDRWRGPARARDLRCGPEDRRASNG